MPFLSHARIWFHRARRLARGILYYDHWMVGVIDQPIANALEWKKLPKVRWIEPFNKNRTLACPFPWPGSDDTILCENFDLTTQTRHLAAVKINPNGIEAEVNLKMPLRGPLSFPYLFMRDGIVYAMPESSAAGRLEIFRWQEYDGTWVSHTVVFENKPVANAILFEKDGWFWISYTDLTKTPRDNLHLIYSSRLGGPWRLHSCNPVQTGRKTSRNAGAIFAADNRLYRPAQDSSQLPGGALRIMEIVTCTPLAYSEREVTRILPPASLYPDGFRTLSAWGDKCLIDGMRQTFSLRQAWGKLKEKFQRLSTKIEAKSAKHRFPSAYVKKAIRFILSKTGRKTKKRP